MRRIRFRAVLSILLLLAASLGLFKTVTAQSVTVVAVGDICLANGVETAMRERGRGYPFNALKSTMRNADIVFGNLECCMATGGKKVEKKYNFRGHPRGALALKEAGFHLISLANNHSLDFGKPALAETLGYLRQQGITAVGAGRTMREARRLHIVNKNGLRIGFLAYLGLYPSVVKLTANQPAVAMADLGPLKREIREARKRVDFLLVSLHAGKEYTFIHTPRQAEIAHTAIDAGADMVIGHHPHVVQDIENYRGKQIFYSLGNFVFNPSPTFLKDQGRRWSAMVVARLEKGQPAEAEMVDLRIVDRQPGFADTAAAQTASRYIRVGDTIGSAAPPAYLKPAPAPALKTHQR